jgi:hypothetical protein
MLLSHGGKAMKTYETLSEATNDLVRRGYNHTFGVRADCLECHENGVCIRPEEFEVDEVHRFEGPTDPGDENILLAISSAKHGLKGIVISAFGAYAEPVSDELIKRLGRR